MCGRDDDPSMHDRPYIDMLDVVDAVSVEAVCANCGEDIIVPADEDPEDTLCVPCAEEEMEG